MASLEYTIPYTTLDDYSQQPSSPPTLSTFSQFDDLEVPILHDDPYQFSASTSQLSSSSSLYSDDTQKAISRPRTSWIYKHMPDSNIETKYFSSTNRPEWRCRYCSKKYATNGGTRQIKAHLTEIHGISELSLRQERANKRQISIEDALITATSNPQKRRRLSSKLISMNISIKLLTGYNLDDIDYINFISQSDVNPDQLEVLLTTLITECNLPLRLVESPAFRNLLTYLNRQVEPWLPEDHHTIQTWISRQFDFQKQQVKKRLQASLSCIHITTDLWTSGNDLALLGAIAHFVTPQGNLEEVLICLKEVDGSHTGENLSQYILQAINDFDITSRLGYFQMDNAPNNDTMLREVSACK
jgi:hypothetical protein